MSGLIYHINTETGQIVAKQTADPDPAINALISPEPGCELIADDSDYPGGMYWHDGESFVQKTELACDFDRTTITADGMDEVTLSGLPQELVTVFVGDDEVDTDSGELVLSFTTPGGYMVRMELAPYIARNWVIYAS